MPVPMEPLLPRKLTTDKDKAENGLLAEDKKKLSWVRKSVLRVVSLNPLLCLWRFLYCASPETIALYKATYTNREKY